MAKIGGMELLVVLIVALFAIGPERLPKVARKMGRMLSQFRKVMNDATEELKEASDEFREVSDEIDGVRKSLQNTLKETDEEVRGVVKETDKALQETSREMKEAIQSEKRADDHAEETAAVKKPAEEKHEGSVYPDHDEETAQEAVAE
ncbi:MAG: Sec-independent protein translocase protein TatB [Christensenellales bacterium]|nr:Sec-independent protein translocase protein TatB [Christensenellales bacterium]